MAFMARAIGERRCVLENGIGREKTHHRIDIVCIESVVKADDQLHDLCWRQFVCVHGVALNLAIYSL